MVYASRFIKNYEKHSQNEDVKRALRYLASEFEPLLKEEAQMLERTFVDGFETSSNKEDQKSLPLAQIYIKENYQI